MSTTLNPFQAERVVRRLASMPAKQSRPLVQLLSGTRARPAADSPELGKLLARARDAYAQAAAEDFAPIRDALKTAVNGEDVTDAVRILSRKLDTLAPNVVAARASAATLYDIFSAALAEGLAEDVPALLPSAPPKK